MEIARGVAFNRFTVVASSSEALAVTHVRGGAATSEPSQLFDHRLTDETFELIPASPGLIGGRWRKLFRSSVKGTWPDELILLKPGSE